jgi:hypothetical protein
LETRRKKTTRKNKTWVGNVIMDVGQIEWGGVDWICVAQGRDKLKALVNAV